MRKILCILCALVLAFALAACADNGTGTDETKGPDKEPYESEAGGEGEATTQESAGDDTEVGTDESGEEQTDKATETERDAYEETEEWNGPTIDV